MGLGIHDTIVLVNKQDMNDWTYFSLWRLWFTCKAPANSWTPSALISFLLRLQNVGEQKRYVVQETFMNIQQQYINEEPKTKEPITDSLLSNITYFDMHVVWEVN